MKVSLTRTLQASKQPDFKGREIAKNEYGERYYRWSAPFDPSRFDCYLDVYPVTPDRNGDYYSNDFKKRYKDIRTGEETIKLEAGINNIDLDYIFGRVEDAPFAYRYRLQPKNDLTAPPIFMVDTGDIVDKRNYMDDWENVYNIVVPTGSMGGKAGAAILIGADNFDVRYKYDKKGNIVPNPNAEKNYGTFKNFSNHIGGSLAGVHQALRDGRLDPYSIIFYLPHASGDHLSPAGYWLESGFQLSAAGDTIDNFTRFQNELFAKGKKLVMDSALTSEGMSGIHIQSILQHGEDDVFFDWFRARALKNMTAKIGAFGTKTQFIRHKLINAPANPVQDANGHITWVKNLKYEKHNPTYVQVYNVDQASPEQITNPNLKIDKYGNPNGSNPLRYGTHNDTMMAYSFPINFKTYEENVGRLNELNKTLRHQKKAVIPLESYMGTRILTKFEKFEFENKIDGGFYTWDANADIAKFDYADTVEDLEEAMHLPLNERNAYFLNKAQKRCEVLDYAVSSLTYWIGKTNQELNLYVAQNLKGMDTSNAAEANKFIRNQIKKGILPEKINQEKINEEVIDNVLNDDYLLHGKDSVDNFHDTILGGLMAYPLESTEAGKDILALFSTPYITNRATKPEFIGQSRFELLQHKNPHLTTQYENVYNLTTRMYSEEMYDFARQIIDEINKNLPADSKLNRYGDTSDYGKYVLPIITQEIAKFAVVKGLFPDIDYEINQTRGGITYDYDAMKEKSLKSLEIPNTNQENEAEDLVLKLKRGIRNISESDKRQLVKAIRKMIDGTNLKDFEMAEMIVDRTGLGMQLRVDAAKDFSNMDGLRNGADRFDDNWNEVIRILNTIGSNTRKVNPNIYIVSEITNEVDLYKLGEGDMSNRFNWKKGVYDGKFEYTDDLIMKLIRETQTDAVANYQKYFTNIGAIYGKKGDDGQDWGENQDERMYNIFRQAKSEDRYDRSRDGANDAAEAFLFSVPYDSISKSYTFVANHDKPRINHVLSLDMELFFANLNKNFTEREKSYRRRAYAVLNPDKDANNYDAVNNYDFSYVSSMAVARGESLNAAFNETVNKLAGLKDSKGHDYINPAQKDEILFGLKKIVAELASGKYKGVNFEPDTFGVEEVDKLIGLVVDEYADRNSDKLSPEARNVLFDLTFEDILDTALNNSLGMDKFLVNSPGIPTIYAGDETGSTGFERMKNNSFTKNRSAVRHDYVDKYDFIKKRKEQKEAVMMLRSRPALHALNDGATYLLKQQNSNRGVKVTGLLRYSTDGSAVISLLNTSGISHDYRRKTDPYNNSVVLNGNRIDLSYDGRDGFIGLHGGLEQGMEFVNAYDPNDRYKVFWGGGDNYYLAKDQNCSQEIVLTDNTLTLYHAPQELQNLDTEFLKRVENAKKSNTSFCGKTYVNQVYNVAPVNYQIKEDVKTGSKLELISK